MVRDERPIATEAALDVLGVQRPASVLRGQPAGRRSGTELADFERIKRVSAWHERAKALELDVLRHGAKVMSVVP